MTCTNPDCAYCGWLALFGAHQRAIQYQRAQGDMAQVQAERRGRSNARRFLQEYPGCVTRLAETP